MFESLLSNNLMKSQLTHAVQNKKTLHAYMFCGPDGSGKKTAAVAFAAELMGDAKQKALKGTHPDVIFVKDIDGKDVPSVKTIKNMRADAFITPTEAAKKVYIIDNAGELSEQSQNALLTILEQPPSFCVFILLCRSRENMLSTIISRCTVYDMEDVDTAEGVEYLKKALPKADAATLEFCIKASGGNLGLAKKMAADKKFKEQVEACENIVKSAVEGNLYVASKYVCKLTKDGIKSFLPVLSMYLRDVLVLATTKNKDSLIFKDSILKYEQTFSKIKADRIYNCLSGIACATQNIENYANISLVTCELIIAIGGLNS